MGTFTRDQRIAALHAEAAKRLLVIDGAMGTMVQTHGLTEADYRGERFKTWARDLKGNNDLLILTRPAIVGGIHRQYLEAGADIIETATFNSTRVSMADYEMQSLVRELNVEGARLARRVCDEFEARDGRPRRLNRPDRLNRRGPASAPARRRRRHPRPCAARPIRSPRAAGARGSPP